MHACAKGELQYLTFFSCVIWDAWCYKYSRDARFSIYLYSHYLVLNQAEFLYFPMIKEKLKGGENSINSVSAWNRIQILFTSSPISFVWFLFQNIPGLDIWCLCVQMQWLAETYMNRFFIVWDDIYWFSWRTYVS